MSLYKSTPAIYKRNQQTVKAFQWDGFPVRDFFVVNVDGKNALKVETPAGVVFIEPGVWVVGPGVFGGKAQDVMTDYQFHMAYTPQDAGATTVRDLMVEKPCPECPEEVQVGPGANGWYSHKGHTMQHFFSKEATHTLCKSPVGKFSGEGYELVKDTSKPFCPGCKASLEAGLKFIVDTQVKNRANELLEQWKSKSLSARKQEAKQHNQYIYGTAPGLAENHAINHLREYGVCYRSGYVPLGEKNPNKPDCNFCKAAYPEYVPREEEGV